MESHTMFLEILYLLTTVLGISGNVMILIPLMCIIWKGYKTMRAEVILSHLAMANLLVCLTQGIPYCLYALGVRELFTDIMCKILLSIFRAARGLAILLTCLLSCFQCVTIAQSSKCWVYMKVLMHNHLALILVAIYVLNMANCINLPMFTVGARNLTSFKYTFNLGYCLVIYPDQLTIQGIGFGMFTRDLLIVITMTTASGYILQLLYRHGKQVQTIRASQQYKERNAEARASHTVVSLVIAYATLFSLDCLIWFYQLVMATEVHPVVSSVRYYLNMCYSTVVPVIIVVFNRKVRNRLKCASNTQQTDFKQFT
ncbi:olfactory receptor class A-like protein 1 [Ambystoma mexicanum]|uniref:olfactory receptor class A-like protein 1 n=1 Tax=Ambystoma mexicanum TaxID=8296 RepID=UPI0037E87403